MIGKSSNVGAAARVIYTLLTIVIIVGLLIYMARRGLWETVIIASVVFIPLVIARMVLYIRSRRSDQD